jgi:hypothetical protein
MKIIYNNIIPFKGFAAINLFGVLFVRKGEKLNEIKLNHERIHTAQMKELLYVGFYIWYFIEWLIELFRYGGKSYYRNTFEREAYANDENLDYLKTRPFWGFWEYI